MTNERKKNSPNLKPYLRFYGYTPLRLNLEKIGENSKHIYIDNQIRLGK